MNQHKKRSSFSGKIGFVLSAAGASVGLGNIWRFPYLAAKYGGGIFLIVYIFLAMTFGYTMIIAETALGRMTKKSPVGAYDSFGKSKWLSLGGWINAIIPILIVPYYSVIGGWITKYFVTYIISDGKDAAADGYFTSFITSDIAPIVFMLVFLALTAWIVYRGVEKGIEQFSKIIMLFFLKNFHEEADLCFLCKDIESGIVFSDHMDVIPLRLGLENIYEDGRKEYVMPRGRLVLINIGFPNSLC